MGGRDALIEELRATVARLEAVIEQQAARIAVLELELAEAIPLQDQLGSDETRILRKPACMICRRTTFASCLPKGSNQQTTTVNNRFATV